MQVMNDNSIMIGFELLSTENLFTIQGGEENKSALYDTIKKCLIKLFGIGENTNN